MLTRLLEIESDAATVESAVEQSLAILGCSRAEVETTILQTPDRGLLRLLRGRTARVRLRLCDRAFIARRVAEHLLQLANIPARVEVLPSRSAIELRVESDLPGLVIGRRGQNLEALQALVTLLSDRGCVERTPILIAAGAALAGDLQTTPCAAALSPPASVLQHPSPEEARTGSKSSHRLRRAGRRQGRAKATRSE